MALSKELLKRLNTDDEPLEKRIKLAQNAFCKVDLPIVQKESVVAEWLCKICESDVVDRNAWEMLQFFLKSNNFNVKYDIKERIVNMLIKKFQEREHICNEILVCCTLLFKHIGMQQYFSNKPKYLGILTRSILQYVFEYLKCTLCSKDDSSICIDVTLLEENNELCLIHNTVLSIIESILQIYGNYVNAKDELRKIFVHDILYPMCIILYHKCTDSTNRLGAVAHNCVQHLVFGKSKFVQSNITMVQEDSFITELCSVLRNNTKTMGLKINLDTYVFVFRAAIGLYKSNSAIVDFIFRKLIDCTVEYKQEIFSSLLQCLRDVILDFNNKINDVTLSQYIQTFIGDILSNEYFSHSDYTILIELLYLNPLLLENKIFDILKRLLLQEQTIEYTNLLVSILEASIRLRKQDKFIFQLLSALKQPFMEKQLHRKNEFFPHAFRDKLTKSINDVTNTQISTVMKILIDCLSTDCVEVLKSNTSCKNMLIIKATSELLIAILNGIHIFESSSTLSSQQKFVKVFCELGNILSLLIQKSLLLKHNKKVVVILLSAVLSWSELHTMINYYAPKAIKHELSFPIQDDHWHELIQSITTCKQTGCMDNMNKLMLHRLKICLPNKSSIVLNDLIGDMEHYWNIILRSNIEIISYMSNKDILDVTRFLLANMISNENIFNEWIDILNKECIQENKCFMTFLLGHTLIHIGSIIPSGVTESITNHIDLTAIVKAEMKGSKKIFKILEHMREEILKNNWKNAKSTVFNEVKLCLKILCHIPLITLQPDVRTLIFIVVYAVNVECNQIGEISDLCNEIFSDLSEKAGVCISEYIDLTVIINYLPKNGSFKKLFEYSLQKISSYDDLKKVVKYSLHSKESMYNILQCINNIKSRLDTDQRPIFNRAEEKLIQLTFSMIPEHINESIDVQILTLVLRNAILKETLDENVKRVAEITLSNIFTTSDSLNTNVEQKLIQEGLELATVIFKNHNSFEVPHKIVHQIWLQIFRCPCQSLLKPLLRSTSLDEFHTVLQYLHQQMDKALSDQREDLIENIFNIWKVIIKVDMSIAQEKQLLQAINNLFQIVQLKSVQKHWPYFLKLFQTILNAMHSYKSGYHIDMCIHSCLQSLDEINISACEGVLALCGTLLTQNKLLMQDRLPSLLLIYRRLIKTIVAASKINVKNKIDNHHFKCLAHDFEKLTINLLRFKKGLVRLSPYIIADLLKLLKESSSTLYIKDCIENVIGQFISICDKHGMALLFRSLPTHMHEVFKIQLEKFNKYHKFTGKI